MDYEKLFKKHLASTTELVQQGQGARSVVTNVYGRHLSQRRRQTLERMVSAYGVFLKANEPVSGDELDYKPFGRGRWLRVFVEDLEWLEDFCEERYGTLKRWTLTDTCRFLEILVVEVGECKVVDCLRSHPASDLASCIAQSLWLGDRTRATLAQTLADLVEAMDESVCLRAAVQALVLRAKNKN
jgi:hypothetical protein